MGRVKGRGREEKRKGGKEKREKWEVEGEKKIWKKGKRGRRKLLSHLLSYVCVKRRQEEKRKGRKQGGDNCRNVLGLNKTKGRPEKWRGRKKKREKWEEEGGKKMRKRSEKGEKTKKLLS